MYRAILFDLDDTLYDLHSYWRERLRVALDVVLARYTHFDREALVWTAMSERVYMEHWPDFLRRQGVDDEALIAAAHEVFRHEWFERMALYDDAAPTLEALRRRYNLGLITNGPGAIQRAKIERFGLADYFDVLIISGEVGVAKPDPAIFMLALERLGVGPAEALFVGDMLKYDLLGAEAAGIPFVWMNAAYEELPSEYTPPLATIARLRELVEIMERLDQVPGA
jgi:putative hydrolase of the HAD superfamily